MTAVAAPSSARSSSGRPNISVWKMLKSKRSTKRNGRIDDLKRSSKKNKRTYLTRSSTKNKTICYGVDTSDLHLESNQGASSELSEEVASNLSNSVVSLALCNGRSVLFTCSGIAVAHKQNISWFLTSASLVEALKDKEKYHDNLKVEVRHEDNVAIGSLGEYDLDCNIAAVKVKNFPDIQTTIFKIQQEFPPHSNVVAVGRDISGKLITTSGILNCHLNGSLPSLMTATCKISKVSEGGPLFDYDGNFLGMNLSFSTEETSFMPEARLFEKLWNCFTILRNAGESSDGEMPNSHQEVNLDAIYEDQYEFLGYPKPPKSMLNDGIILANTFEDPFGDIYGTGVWRDLSETVASKIHENTVALASFNGEKRFFACTGCFIEWNGCTIILTAASLIRDSYFEDKIVENLKIKVLLPNKELAEGILQHYNLHYNIALVSVSDFCASQPIKIQHRWRNNNELLAVGRIFELQKLMAARGLPLSKVVTHDCKSLRHTTCEISKAGIGGPLFDFDGKFVGMNAYDKYARGTPYLSWDLILLVLENFNTKRTVPDAGHDGYPSRLVDWTIAEDESIWVNSWHVPLAFWTRPDDLERHDNEIRLRRPQYIEI